MGTTPGRPDDADDHDDDHHDDDVDDYDENDDDERARVRALARARAPNDRALARTLSRFARKRGIRALARARFAQALFCVCAKKI